MTNTAESLNALVTLLGEKNAEKLKSNIVDLITNQINNDFISYGKYLLYPPDIHEIINETVKDTENKIRKMYKDAAIEINQDYIEKMKQYMAQQINSPDKNMRKKNNRLCQQTLLGE